MKVHLKCRVQGMKNIVSTSIVVVSMSIMLSCGAAEAVGEVDKGLDWLREYKLIEPSYSSDQQQALNYLVQAFYYTIKAVDAMTAERAAWQTTKQKAKAAWQTWSTQAAKQTVQALRNAWRTRVIAGKFVPNPVLAWRKAKELWPLAGVAAWQAPDAMWQAWENPQQARPILVERYNALLEHIIIPHAININITLGPDAGRPFPGIS